ncbi:MAG: RagB/SusD family nutrient uptake outer membrane protein [Bacteroidota bacterium]|nr:RagB/SusD family nutrient uptake outer membrane protein [Bacteroidota bacterium]
MKKIFFIILLASFAFVSCNDDLLNKKPLDQFSESDVWKDGALADGFILNIYGSVVRDMYANQQTDGWTDNSVVQDNGTALGLQQGSVSNEWDMGWNQYSKIRKCNLAIQKLTGNTSILPEKRDALIGEARLLRAMIYYDLVKKFGGVMLVDKVLTPNDSLQIPRSSETDVYSFIDDDIDEAAKLLPATAPQGRLTKAAAYALYTDVGLQQGNYDKVIAAASEIEKMSFTLDPNYKNIFNSFTGSTTSPEVIFLYETGQEKTTYLGTRMFWYVPNVENGTKLRADAVPQLNDAFLCWPGYWPSQELVDAYLFNEGGNAVQHKGIEFQGKPSRLMWKNRDLRFEQSIVRDSAMLKNSILTFRRGGNMHWTSNPLSTWGMPKTGYIFRKWMYENDFIYCDNKVTWAEPLWRLGKIYLNKAEAYGRKGEIENAVEYMNKTRTTHGGLPALVTTDAAEFWKYYKIERRVELMQENDRYWSLIRWAKAEKANSIQELDGYKLHGLDMNFDGLVNVIECPFTGQMRFDMPKRLLFPVPAWEVKANIKLVQNPGWE